MKVQAINNNYNNTNFGATIKGTSYLRQQVRHYVKDGTLEEKGELLNFLKIIKDDKRYHTFKMDCNVENYKNNLVAYTFTLARGGKRVYKYGPLCNQSAVHWDEKDSYFLRELSEFIKEHYGDEKYNDAVKNMPECVQKVQHNDAVKNMPECVQKVQQAIIDANTQLRTDLRDTLHLGMEGLRFYRNGVPVPAKFGEGPVPPDYVC